MITIILFTKQKKQKNGGILKKRLRNVIGIFKNEIETFSVEIINGKSRNFIVTGVYRQPKGDIKVFKN